MTTDREDHLRSGRTEAGRECDRDPEVGGSSWTNAQGKLLRMRCVRQLKCVAEGWPSRGKAGNTARRRRICTQLVGGGIERLGGLCVKNKPG